MCASEGMGLAPWGALGGGEFKTKKQRDEMNAKGEGGRNFGGPSEKHRKLTNTLPQVAERNKTAITSVALAYAMHRAPHVFPIVGGRKIDHLKGNVEALSLGLSDEAIAEINGSVPFDVGFPMNSLSKKPGGPRGPDDVWLSQVNYLSHSSPVLARKTYQERLYLKIPSESARECVRERLTSRNHRWLDSLITWSQVSPSNQLNRLKSINRSIQNVEGELFYSCCCSFS